MSITSNGMSSRTGMTVGVNVPYPDVRVFQYPELAEMNRWAPGDLEQAVNDNYDAALASVGVIRSKKVQRRPYEWLWHGRLLKRKLHVIAGDGDLGKSWVAMDMAARISAGLPWPDGTIAPKGAVFYISAEDDNDDTVLPRIEAMGGNMENVFCEAVEDSLTLDDKAEKLRSWISMTDAIYVVLDPISAFLGGLSIHSGNGAAVRQALSPLRAVASQTGAAIVSIMHLNKNADQTAGQRISGSADFKNVTRFGFMVAPDPDDTRTLGDPLRRRFFLNLKKNLVSTTVPTLSYHTLPDPVDEAKGQVVWEGPVAGVDLEAVLQGPSKQDERESAARDKAKAFLREFLADGYRLSADVLKEAKARGISPSTYDRAREALRDAHEVESFRVDDMAGKPPALRLSKPDPAV